MNAPMTSPFADRTLGATMSSSSQGRILTPGMTKNPANRYILPQFEERTS